METQSSIPVRASGIPRPASRLPVLRAPASQSQLRPAPSSEHLRRKPSASLLRPGPPTASVPLQRKPSRTSLARPAVSAAYTPAPTSSVKVPLAASAVYTPASTSSIKVPLAAPTKRTIPGSGSVRPPPANAPVFKKPVGRLPSREIRIASQSSAAARSAQQKADELADLDAFRPASRSSSRESSQTAFRDSPESPVEIYVNPMDDAPATPAKQGTRLSLSDRTIETLSQIQSPPTAKGRRSSFFNNGGSLMPPPLRPTSAMGGNRRPTTSDGAPNSGPTTPNRLGGAISRGSMTAPGKRSVSANTATNSTPSKMPPVGRPFLQSKKAPLSQSQNFQATPRPLSNSKTMLSRTPKPRPALTGVFREAVSPPGTAVFQTPSPSRGRLATNNTPDSGRKVSASSVALREQIAKAKAARRTEATAKLEEPRLKPASSSNSLREQIAKAKEVARRAQAIKRFGSTTPPREVPAVTENEFGIEPDPAEIAEFDFGLADPFNQQPKGSNSLLRKRVDAARVEGRLNIAAMGLTEIPDEVLTMYKYDPSDTSFAWGEVVDLISIMAADNELKSLPELMFPDVDYEALAETLIDSDEEGPHFGCIQNLDLHGNILSQLPMGLMRLTLLSKLNLSRNQLSSDAIDVICQITTLRELKIAENSIEGAFPARLAALNQLEVLELQGNKLTSLPSEIRELTHLRTLNVSDNKLRELPLELFTSVPLTELIANKNAFSGSFFAVDTVPHLQHLQLANNSISSLCTADTILLPALKTLNVSANRLTDLPDMSSWTSLITLLIGENKLSSFPDGFVSLQQLRTANFTANDLKKIDEKIALMESLENLTLAANPLRERKFVTMNTADLKRDLQSRLEPDVVDDTTPEDEDIFGAPPITESGWQLKSMGTLDLSFQNLTFIDSEAMLDFAASNEVRQVLLQQNYLTAFPTILAQLTHLTVLDLSKNTIEDPTSILHFPKLRELRLKGNKLQNFDFATMYIEAPCLQHLDISNNRIGGALPVLRDTYPDLIALHASDNSISEVEANALDGLKVVNLSNNEIARLDPRIGLLAGTLNSLEVEGNRFRVPNHTVLRKGTGSVLQWLRDKIPSPVGEGFVEPGSSSAW